MRKGGGVVQLSTTSPGRARAMLGQRLEPKGGLARGREKEIEREERAHYATQRKEGALCVTVRYTRHSTALLEHHYGGSLVQVTCQHTLYFKDSYRLIADRDRRVGNNMNYL